MARAPERDTSRPVTPTPRPGVAPTPPKPAARKSAPKPASRPRTGSSPTGGARPANDHALVSGGPFWGNPDAPGYAQENIVTIHTDGLSFSVNKAVATQMSGLIHDLVLAGYHPKSVQGFNNRPITDGTGKSNHAYGAAIDIDPGDNPRFVGRDGKHKIDDKIARTLAAKWGFKWGGDYKNSKDYMHFESLGAPRTPGSPPGGTQPVITAAAKAAGATIGIPATSSATAVPSTGTGLGADGTIDTATALAAYGGIAELAKTVPDIKRVIDKAIKDGIDPTTTAGQQIFQQRLQATAWWKQTASKQRENQILKANDPRKWKENRQAYHDKIVVLARNLGVPMTDDAAITKLAERAMNLGWGDAEIQRYVAADIKVVSGTANTGQAAVIVNDLKAKAADWLVPISDATLQTWTRQILKGDVPAESFDAYLKEQAKSMFPGLAAAIDRGVTVKQYTDPYRQYAAQLLEIDPNMIDFVHDPKFSKALFNTDPKTGERSQMSLADWQTYLRKTPDYAKTAQAVDQGAKFSDLLTTAFGKVAA